MANERGSAAAQTAVMGGGNPAGKSPVPASQRRQERWMATGDM